MAGIGGRLEGGEGHSSTGNFVWNFLKLYSALVITHTIIPELHSKYVIILLGMGGGGGGVTSAPLLVQ